MCVVDADEKFIKNRKPVSILFGNARSAAVNLLVGYPV